MNEPNEHSTEISPACQHPFGDGVHVITPEGDLLGNIIELMKLDWKIGLLSEQLAAKIKPGQIGAVTTLAEGEPPSGFTHGWLVLKLWVRYRPDKHPEASFMRAVILFSEPGFEELAAAGAKLFKPAIGGLPCPAVMKEWKP